ncbi:hypothetical protein OAO18_02490 [Francisellaceae bacterium]|nr:hypothetical protein [Francisellaceae bacterium]
MKVIRYIGVCALLAAPLIANSFDLKVGNNTGHDVQSVVLYNNGSSVSGETCLRPDGTVTDINLPADSAKYGKISAAFIKRYSSSDGSCTMQSSRVGYSNIVSFNADDLNKNSTDLHYFAFTSTGLNMTPVVILNPQLKSVSMYTGYRQGDKGQSSYAFYDASNPDILYPPSIDNSYSENAYIKSGQSLYLY